MEEEINRLSIGVAKAKRRQCSCYMNLCGDCQDAGQLLALLDEWNPIQEEGSYERYGRQVRWTKKERGDA